MAMSRIARILEDRRARREAAARLAADRALAELAQLGVTARLTGSLARGDFNIASDVDILVIDCPDKLRYAIESKVEDVKDAMPFHVIYLDEVRSDIMRQRLLRDGDNESVAS